MIMRNAMLLTTLASSSLAWTNLGFMPTSYRHRVSTSSLHMSAVEEATLTPPRIIQGGMGVRISSWLLARSVAEQGELGIISGTVLDTVLVRALQQGDPNGDVRRALATFPDQDMVQRVMDKYFIEGGKADDKPFRALPMWSVDPSQALLEATVLANYMEVWLAKHDDESRPLATITGAPALVGINRLTKVPLPTLASLYGAILADVDYVIMGAGIPLKVPGALDKLAVGEPATFPVDVAGAKSSGVDDEASNANYDITFSPTEFWTKAGKPELAEQLAARTRRPQFLPIVSSVVLAQSMLKRANGAGPTKGINGFVIELPTAGGHNAPPRGFRYDPVAKSHAMDLNEKGEPIYGPKDDVDLAKFAKSSKGLPFWLAGSYGHPDKLVQIVKEVGGAGIQVGTMFALAEESGMIDSIKSDILREIATKEQQPITVFTDPVASPTGYPFKVLQLGNTLSDASVYEERPRQCSLGYLRTPYLQESGKVGYRCPAEPVDDWLKKGGSIEATVGRKCLCNALMANIGMPQVRNIKNRNGEKSQYVEDTLITIGDDILACKHLIEHEEETGRYMYTAANVVKYLRSTMDQVNFAALKEEISPAVFVEEPVPALA